ncbi:uncharacterized protein LOC142227059 isoform X2 [Haematobia irritans]|uniref:uncharacterized protein LOC142227059 isoform X2 n=1 Tax=Haematobia irritans TaxID=7368 RepID=UPI003F50B4E1
MEGTLKSSNNRIWRKQVKKLQRKRRRQNAAKERDKKLEEEIERLKDPTYKQWLEHQEHLEEMKRKDEEREREEMEENWLRRELLAQKQFQKEKLKRLAEEKIEEERRQKQLEELKEREEAKTRQREEMQRKTEEATRDLEETVQICDQYLEDICMLTPPKLKGFLETRPGEKVCEFYRKTQCCRFGFRCSHNHTRPLLSRIILIRHFFQHRLLDHCLHEEYSSAEENLEMGEGDLKIDYQEFCYDVWPVLEQFGEIVNFRTVRNRLPNAKGNVFVEYKDKRSALKAFINLQNRYYAAKRLHIEFSHITNWRIAACGFYLAHKCPRGADCNYLHFIPNPQNKYNEPFGSLDRSQRSTVGNMCSTRQQTPLISWNNVTNQDNRCRNWRWSESPEMEILPSKSSVEPISENPKNPICTTSKPKENDFSQRRSRLRSRERHPSPHSKTGKRSKGNHNDNSPSIKSTKTNKKRSDRDKSTSSDSYYEGKYHRSDYRRKSRSHSNESHISQHSIDDKRNNRDKSVSLEKSRKHNRTSDRNKSTSPGFDNHHKSEHKSTKRHKHKKKHKKRSSSNSPRKSNSSRNRK